MGPVIKEVSKCFGMGREEILSKKRGNIYRQMALYLIKKSTPLSLKEIGSLFNMDYTAVSYAARRFEERLKKDERALNMLNEITQKM